MPEMESAEQERHRQHESTGYKHHASGGNFSCTGNIGLWSRNGKASRDHVHHVGCIFWHRIPYEAAYDRKYLPFMVSVYEGGSMAYPLYTSLCGQDNLSQIAVLDIAGLLFGFSIYMGMLGQTENGEKINVKKLAVSAVKTPAFIASVLGIIAGLTGVIKFILVSPAGGIYTSVENILTAALTAIILIVVGFSMELTPELFRPCVRTIVMRIVLQAVMIVCVLLAVHSFIGSNKLLDLAVITYMSAPATFSMQTFLKREDGSAYVSTTNSLYCIVSVVVYMILAFFTY